LIEGSNSDHNDQIAIVRERKCGKDFPNLAAEAISSGVATDLSTDCNSDESRAFDLNQR
jgi:hypothetical protein